MCGRCRQNASAQDLANACNAHLNHSSDSSSSSSSSGNSSSSSGSKDCVEWNDDKHEERNRKENVSPGQHMTVLREKKEGGGLELVPMVWGLVPSYIKSRKDVNHWRMFNARSETVLSNGVFSRLTEKRRCAIPLNGFYEWQTLSNGKKQPFYLTLKEKSMIFAAGLYDVGSIVRRMKNCTLFMVIMDACLPSFIGFMTDSVLLNTTPALRKWISCVDVSATEALKEARTVGAQIHLSFNPHRH